MAPAPSGSGSARSWAVLGVVVAVLAIISVTSGRDEPRAGREDAADPVPALVAPSGSPAVTATPSLKPTPAPPSPAAAAPPSSFGVPEDGEKLRVTVSQDGACQAGSRACSFQALYQNLTKRNQDEWVIADDYTLVDTQDRQYEMDSGTFGETVDLQPEAAEQVAFTFKDLPADFQPAQLRVLSGGAEFTIQF